MDDLHKVRRRIASRRIGLEEEEHSKGAGLFRLLYHAVMLLMFVCVAVLALLLNQKLHLVQMPAFMEELHLEQLSSWVPFETWFSLKDTPVSNTQKYTKTGEDTYRNDSNSVYNLYDGVVLHIQPMENGTSNVTMKQDNGVVTTYEGVIDVSIKEEERILKDKIMGTYGESIGISFMKNNQKLEMNEALQS